MLFTAALRQRLLFAFLCTVWGATWLTMKIGTVTVPPAFFSGTRWTAAGIILLVFRYTRGERLRIPRRLFPRLVVVAVLMVALNATIMLYGLRHVGSGLAAILSSALTPISLLGFGVALGQEKFSRTQAAAIGLGLAGILLLFGPRAIIGRLDAAELLGALGIVGGTLSYTLGSVLARPLMRVVSPAEVAAGTNLVGGITLLALSLAFEPGSLQALSGNWGLPAWASWFYLLLPGSLAATIIYFYLVREWGAARTGTYAFVSPVIAVLLGIVLLGEEVDAVELVGMALMLVAVSLILRSPRTEPAGLALRPVSAMRSGDPGGVT